MAEISKLNGYDIKDKKSIRTYDTIALMKADTTIKEGQHIKTRGYYAVNDGGYGEYIIVNDDNLVEDGGSIHELSNGLFAKLLFEDSITINNFGAYGDGVHDDSDALQNAIDYCATNKLILKGNTPSIYLISKTLNITSLNTNINLNDATIQASDNFTSTNDCIIYINVTGANHTTLKRISHFKLNCNYINVGKAFNIASLGRCFFEYINIIRCFNRGLYITGGFEVYYNNIFMSAIDLNISTASEMGTRTAIEVTTDDLYFTNITAIDFTTCLSLHDTSNYFENIHAWIWSSFNLKGSKFAIIERGTATLSNCYSDTYESVLCSSQETGNYKCNGLKTFFNAGFFDSVPNDLNMYLFNQTNNATNYYYFRRTSIINSVFNAHSDHHYNLSNTTKSLLANINETNTFNNIDNIDVRYKSTLTFVSGVEDRNSHIVRNNGITQLDLNIGIDLTQVSTGSDYKVANINNMNAMPSAYTGFRAVATSSEGKVFGLYLSIDAPSGDSSTSGQIRIRNTQTLIDNNCNQIILHTSFTNVSNT